MLWVVYCLDESDAFERRIAARQAHSAHLKAGPVKPLLYGPLMAHDGETAIGSLFIVEADAQHEVTTFFAEDPYMRQCVWSEIQVHGFVLSQNSPIQRSKTCTI